jgi:hypothetical protein
MATTAFADPPNDRNELELQFADPPTGIAVHISYYIDDECCVPFTFIAPIELTTFVPAPPDPCSLQ